MRRGRGGRLPAHHRAARARRLLAPAVRIETGVDSGDEISPYYDSMIAKLIARGPTATRRRALAAGLRETTVIGLTTNLQFLHELLHWPADAGRELPHAADRRACRRAECRVECRGRRRRTVGAPGRRGAALARRAACGRPALGCWSEAAGFTGWRLGRGAVAPAPLPSVVLGSGRSEWPVRYAAPAPDGRTALAIGEQALQAALVGAHALPALAAGRRLLSLDGRVLEVALADVPGGVEVVSALGRSVFECTPYLGGALGEEGAGGLLLAPMMGKVVAVRAAAGAAIASGQTVIVLESMKMELHVSAPFDGTVATIRCAVGDMVERHQPLAEVAPSAAS